VYFVLIRPLETSLILRDKRNKRLDLPDETTLLPLPELFLFDFLPINSLVPHPSSLILHPFFDPSLFKPAPF
jgi:hypothetical protein